MSIKCILVRSVTYAQKSMNLLERKGITARISKQATHPKYGCTWCVKVRPQDLDRALALMRQENIKMTGDIYDLP